MSEIPRYSFYPTRTNLLTFNPSERKKKMNKKNQKESPPSSPSSDEIYFIPPPSDNQHEEVFDIDIRYLPPPELLLHQPLKVDDLEIQILRWSYYYQDEQRHLCMIKASTLAAYFHKKNYAARWVGKSLPSGKTNLSFMTNWKRIDKGLGQPRKKLVVLTTEGLQRMLTYNKDCQNNPILTQWFEHVVVQKMIELSTSQR